MSVMASRWSAASAAAINRLHKTVRLFIQATGPSERAGRTKISRKRKKKETK